MDETSFVQGNQDGHNPQQHQGWLWVMVTVGELLSRLAQPFSSLPVGPGFKGILTSDSAYNWLAAAHKSVGRISSAISPNSRGIGRSGSRLAGAGETPVCLVVSSPRWHLVSSRFERAVAPIRSRVHELLIAAATNEIGTREKTGKTVRTCRQLLQVEPALWLFVTTVGVEPTNNAAERAIRPAVLWRRTSFGSQSQAGSLLWHGC